LEVAVTDYTPGAVPPSSDPLGDPAQAELQARIDAAKVLLDGLPIAQDTVDRLLERDAVEAAALLKQHEWSYFWRLRRKLAPFTILRQWDAAIKQVAEELAEGEQKVAERVRLVALGAEAFVLWHDGSEAWCSPNVTTVVQAASAPVAHGAPT
jgi:hypothetical protein